MHEEHIHINLCKHIISVHNLANFKIELVMANKRKKATIREKLNVIGQVAHLNVPHTEMSNCLGLPPSRLSKISLSKQKITNAYCNLRVGHRPRKKEHEPRNC
jgi:hypothetical protein